MAPLDIIFWLCMMLGGMYMLIVSLMGGLSHAIGGAAHHVGDAFHHVSDGGGHAHVGDHIDTGAHHGGDAGHHTDSGHHGDHAHDHGHDSGDQEEGIGRFNLLTYLNPMSLSSFLFGFGGVGVLCRLLNMHPLTSSLYACAGGFGLWWIAYFMVSRMFANAGGTSHYRMEDTVGLRGTVTAPIAGEKPGMVCFTMTGTRQQVRAITDDEEPIPIGSTVRIRHIEKNTALVMRIDNRD